MESHSQPPRSRPPPVPPRSTRPVDERPSDDTTQQSSPENQISDENALPIRQPPLVDPLDVENITIPIQNMNLRGQRSEPILSTEIAPTPPRIPPRPRPIESQSTEPRPPPPYQLIAQNPAEGDLDDPQVGGGPLPPVGQSTYPNSFPSGSGNPAIHLRNPGGPRGQALRFVKKAFMETKQAERAEIRQQFAAEEQQRREAIQDAQERLRQIRAKRGMQQQGGGDGRNLQEEVRELRERQLELGEQRLDAAQRRLDSQREQLNRQREMMQTMQARGGMRGGMGGGMRGAMRGVMRGAMRGGRWGQQGEPSQS